MSHAIPAPLVGSFSNFGRPLQNCAVVPFLLFELLFSPIPTSGREPERLDQTIPLYSNNLFCLPLSYQMVVGEVCFLGWDTPLQKEAFVPR